MAQKGQKPVAWARLIVGYHEAGELGGYADMEFTEADLAMPFAQFAKLYLESAFAAAKAEAARLNAGPSID